MRSGRIELTEQWRILLDAWKQDIEKRHNGTRTPDVYEEGTIAFLKRLIGTCKYPRYLTPKTVKATCVLVESETTTRRAQQIRTGTRSFLLWGASNQVWKMEIVEAMPDYRNPETRRAKQ